MLLKAGLLLCANAALSMAMYSSRDSVVELTSKNFKEEVLNNDVGTHLLEKKMAYLSTVFYLYLFYFLETCSCGILRTLVWSLSKVSMGVHCEKKNTHVRLMNACFVFIYLFITLRLAPAWKKAADNLKGLVTVAAINCDEDSNKPLCGQYDIKGFPTIKTFRPSVNKKGARTKYPTGK